MQLCSKETLEDWLWSKERTDSNEVNIKLIYNFCEQILSGLNHVHQNGLIHRGNK
jgi:serine/threonine protein kinase